MIGVCRACKSTYWRYRKDHPPSGYCSVPCHDGATTPPAPPDPHIVLALLRSHMRGTHQTNSLLIWPDCACCEALQARYAEALNGYVAEP
jgi:hypothetical protein